MPTDNKYKSSIVSKPAATLNDLRQFVVERTAVTNLNIKKCEKWELLQKELKRQRQKYIDKKEEWHSKWVICFKHPSVNLVPFLYWRYLTWYRSKVFSVDLLNYIKGKAKMMTYVESIQPCLNKHVKSLVKFEGMLSKALSTTESLLNLCEASEVSTIKLAFKVASDLRIEMHNFYASLEENEESKYKMTSMKVYNSMQKTLERYKTIIKKIENPDAGESISLKYREFFCVPLLPNPKRKYRLSKWDQGYLT